MKSLLTWQVNVRGASRTKSSEMLLLVIMLHLGLLRCVHHVHLRLGFDNDGLKEVRPGTSWETEEPGPGFRNPRKCKDWN